MNAGTGTAKIIQGYVAHLSGPEYGSCKVGISTGDDIAYVVLPKGAGVDLADYISEKVEVQALIQPGEEEAPRILVRSYTLLEDFEA